MKKRYKKLAAAGILLLAALLLTGCVSQIEERALEDLSLSAVEAGVAAPIEDGAAPVTAMATLYFLSEDASSLIPVTRKIEARAGASRENSKLTPPSIWNILHGLTAP